MSAVHREWRESHLAEWRDTGMAERIIDITATGTTLRENNLVVVDDVLASTARFFANPCSYRTNPRVGQLADVLYSQTKEN